MPGIDVLTLINVYINICKIDINLYLKNFFHREKISSEKYACKDWRNRIYNR